LANSGPNTNSSQFFITTTAARQYDFNYTIIGFLTRATVCPGHRRSAGRGQLSGEDSEPVKAVVINSISTYSDTQDGEVLLSAPLGTANNTPVNLTSRPPTHRVTRQARQFPYHRHRPYPPEFTRPFLGASAAAVGTSSAAFTYQIPTATGARAHHRRRDGRVWATVPSQYANDFSISTFSWNGLVTITPLRNFSGVASMTVGAAYSQGLAEAGLDADVQVVPIDVSVPPSCSPAPPGNGHRRDKCHDPVDRGQRRRGRAQQDQPGLRLRQHGLRRQPEVDRGRRGYRRQWLGIVHLEHHQRRRGNLLPRRLHVR